MKTTDTDPKPAGRKHSARADVILAALRDARRSAVKIARMHNTPIVYLRGDTLVQERKCSRR